MENTKTCQEHKRVFFGKRGGGVRGELAHSDNQGELSDFSGKNSPGSEGRPLACC